MSNASWPTTLPEYLLEQGYNEAFGNNKVETSMEFPGAKKTRRRFTKKTKTFACSVALTAAQRATLEVFYEDTLANGSLPFDWVHPTTREATTFMFRGDPPAFTVFGGINFIAAFRLETY